MSGFYQYDLEGFDLNFIEETPEANYALLVKIIQEFNEFYLCKL
jgi:hypothetical protein